MNFDMAFDRLIGNEGGYIDNPQDPGGETSFGITRPTLREAISLKLVSYDTTIASLTREQAKVIYKALVWDRAHMDDYDPAIAFQVFDFAVNSGIETAIRKLQRAVGVADDGHIGMVTLAKIRSMIVTDVLMRFAAERLLFYTSLSIWPTFGKGWARRIAADLQYASEDA